MDPTMTYFKMCSHPKIQEHSHYELGDLVARPLPKDGKAIIVVGYNNQSYLNNQGQKLEYIWLPRQDDIQKMFKEEAFVLSHRFDEEMENFITGDPSWWTMEKLWLAFYMYEKHGLIWNPQKERWERNKK